MRNITYRICLILLLFIAGCGKGEFIAKDKYVLASYPEGFCKDGEEDLNDNSKLRIEFGWDFKGDFEKFRIEIFERDTNVEINVPDIDGNQEKTPIKLDRGKWYVWKIIGINNTEETSSDEITFYSENIPNVDNFPFPVQIEYFTEGNERRIEWEKPEQETLDGLKYQAWFSNNPIAPDAQVNFKEDDLDFQKIGDLFDASDLNMFAEKNIVDLQGDYFFKVESIYETSETKLVTNSYLRISL